MKISVITVSYNSESTIADTLRSVANQTYQNIEHIVIDGQSNDSTISVVSAHNHVNLSVVSGPDDGIYDAMNKGLRHASGDVIGFLNSDDFYEDSTVLEKVAAVFQDESIEACYGDLVYVTPDNSRIVRYWKSKYFVSGDFSKGWAPAHPTFYLRRTALNRVGFFDLSFKLAADFEFMMRYLESGHVKSVYIPHVLVRMRLGGATNRSWSNIYIQNREIFMALKKNNIHFSRLGFLAHKIFNRACQFFVAFRFYNNGSANI